MPKKPTAISPENLEKIPNAASEKQPEQKPGKIDTYYMGVGDDRRRLADAKLMNQVRVTAFDPKKIFDIEKIVEKAHQTSASEEAAREEIVNQELEDQVAISHQTIEGTEEKMEVLVEEEEIDIGKINKALDFFEGKQGHILSLSNPERIYDKLQEKNIIRKDGEKLPIDAEYFLINEAEEEELKTHLKQVGFEYCQLIRGQEKFGFVAEKGDTTLVFLYSEPESPEQKKEKTKKPKDKKEQSPDDLI